MKLSRYRNIALTIAAALLLSACGTQLQASSWPGILVNGDTAYVAYNQHVYALNVENGSQRWQFPAEADNAVSFYARPTLTADGQLLVGTYGVGNNPVNTLYSLDPVDGSQNWAFEGAANRFVGAPLANEHGIFAPNADHSLYALDENGQLRWTFETADPQWAQPAGLGEVIFLPAMDHSLTALDAGTGEVLWREMLSGAIVGVPAIDPEGAVFAGSFGKEIVAFNSDNGSTLWRAETQDWVWGGLAFQDGRLYAADLSGMVHVFDAGSGDPIWSHQIEDGVVITGTPLVLEEIVVVSTEAGQVIALDKETGDPRWTQTFAEQQLYSSPAAAGDLILVGSVSEDAVVMALNQSGTTVWTFMP
jgi:outer membrane protein assembly factor BamB